MHKKEIKKIENKLIHTDNNVLKKYTPNEIRDYILKDVNFEDDLTHLLAQLSNGIFSKYLNGTDNEKQEVNDKVINKTKGVMLAMETDTHTGIMGAFDSDYRGMARELCFQIINEYQCNTNLEKTLAEIIVNSFIRTMDNSRRLNNELNCQNITHERNVYISMLSKQIDRANRQYLSAVMSLKQLKAPTIEMSIKTNTAFISQNQQFNVDKKNNEAK